MKKKLIILLTLMLFAPFVVNAKDWTVDWQKSWGGNGDDEFGDIFQTQDGGFVAYGYSRSTDIEGLPNKGYSDAIIVKFDKDGNMVWQKNWGGSDLDQFESLYQTQDGGFIAAGFSYSKDIEGLSYKGDIDAIIVKYDKDGNMVWQKNWGGSKSEQFNDIVETQDSGVIVTGHSKSKDIEGLPNKGEEDAIIVKFDKDGNVIWQKLWGGNDDDDFRDILQTQDGGFIVEGYSSSTDIEGLPNKSGHDAIIVKYDKDGNIVWQKKYGINDEISIKGIFQTQDGGIITYGETYIYQTIGGQGDGLIVKFDKDGNMVWQNSWGGSEYERFYDVVETQDSGFIAVGYSVSTDIEGLPNKGYSDAIMVKFDKDGNMVWQNSWGGIEGEEFNNLLLTQDGELIVSGYFFNESSASPMLFTQGVRIVPLNYSMSPNIDGLPYKDKKEAVMVKYSFKYDLENTTTENGTSTVEQKGKYGVITPIPNEGYEVDKIIVKDKDGNVLDVEVVKLQDGTYSFELSDDVTVEVLFKKEFVNPKTGLSNIVGIMFTITLCFISGLFILRKYNERYEF